MSSLPLCSLVSDTNIHTRPVLSYLLVPFSLKEQDPFIISLVVGSFHFSAVLELSLGLGCRSRSCRGAGRGGCLGLTPRTRSPDVPCQLLSFWQSIDWNCFLFSTKTCIVFFFVVVANLHVGTFRISIDLILWNLWPYHVISALLVLDAFYKCHKGTLHIETLPGEQLVDLFPIRAWAFLGRGCDWSLCLCSTYQKCLARFKQT